MLHASYVGHVCVWKFDMINNYIMSVSSVLMLYPYLDISWLDTFSWIIAPTPSSIYILRVRNISHNSITIME